MLKLDLSKLNSFVPDDYLSSRREALAQALLQAAGPGDLIWFKASHSMRLEETIELFYQGLEEQAAK